MAEFLGYKLACQLNNAASANLRSDLLRCYGREDSDLPGIVLELPPLEVLNCIACQNITTNSKKVSR